MSSSIQEKFGQVIIDGLTTFAQNGIPDPTKFDTNWFEHVQEKSVRDALCDTLYGARWIYKVGLALQVKDKELFAHVRSQVIDYVSVSETLLAEMIAHGHAKKKLTGKQWQFKDIPFNAADKPTKKIKWWNYTSSRHAVAKQTFKWYMVVAEEEKIIDSALAASLEKMRQFRNTVHITERASAAANYSLGSSAEAFKIMQNTINQTKSWFNKNKT